MDTQNAYFAGILDAKGVLSIRPDGRPRVQVTSHRRELLEAMKESFAGSIAAHGGTFRWDLQGLQVLRMVKVVGPFMVVQQDRARLLGLYCLPETSKERREELAAALRGETPPSPF